MSMWGMWGYVGIVAGRLVLLALFFACMEIMFPTRKSARASSREGDVARRQNMSFGIVITNDAADQTACLPSTLGDVS